jgi:hypothetical protein
MNLKELQDAVSRRTDTAGLSVNRAVTGRVVAVTFDVLAEEMGPLDALDLVLREFRRRAKVRAGGRGRSAGGSAAHGEDDGD